MKTRVKLEFTIDHDGDHLYPLVDPLDFIEGGLQLVGIRRAKGRTHAPPVVRAIEPGAKLVIWIPRKSRVETTAKRGLRR